ncbi:MULTISPECIES: ATP-binding cassette domain-containing protein [unclassified Granulicatella]|uniref:ATP-binding cassette domain-containing protein n=1 Tax=unclassified Granulicatella TaxID=2630493 RepID=UPI001073966C|nr:MULTISPECIES: ATP-binding cassette domain-containing protein [unclassified Granulicatella]MBF0779542.1 ABC transporter ATP-binding protein [Granulicatella sp. 19428wC4_WM01]TFU96506.1 ABC transporter ATP-binding protein [Granulicatella sp. WM01]
MSIQLKQLDVLHGKKVLLHHINLTIPKAQCVVIIGESGAGKTMLLRALMGNLPASTSFSGQLLYDNKEQSLSGNTLAKSKITYMVQNPMSMFNPFQKIESHFIEMVQSHEHLSKKEVLQLAKENLAQVSLEEQVLQYYPFELSGGMLQRIMFAMSLSLNAQVYILDEPTSALDYYTSQFIVHMIQTLKSEGKTVILTTHDYTFAKQVGNTMLVMKKGKHIAHDTVDNILSSKDTYIQSLTQNPYQRLV